MHKPTEPQNQPRTPRPQFSQVPQQHLKRCRFGVTRYVGALPDGLPAETWRQSRRSPRAHVCRDPNRLKGPSDRLSAQSSAGGLDDHVLMPVECVDLPKEANSRSCVPLAAKWRAPRSG